MPIPLTQPCPQCESEMELLTADDEGEIVVYECPDCGAQMEKRVKDDESDDDQTRDRPAPVEEEELDVFESDDAP